jgi:hypothetical protein
MLNRADTDTAHDAFLTLKASKEMVEANPGIALGHVKRKTSTSVSKRKHDSGDGDQHSTAHSTPVGTGHGQEKRYKEGSPLASGGNSTLNNASSLGNQSQQPMQGQNQDQPTTNYDFFFPDLEAMANGRYPPQQPAPTGPAFNPYAYNPQPQYPSVNTPGGMNGGWGMSFEPGSMPYGMAMGYGPSAQNQANFSGFGLTMPANPSVNPGYNAQPGPSAPPSAARPQPEAGAPAAGGSGPEEETAKSKRLKEAVASLTVGDRRALEGTPMTPDEMAERFRVQERLMSSLPEGDQNNRMLEAMQVSGIWFRRRE